MAYGQMLALRTRVPSPEPIGKPGMAVYACNPSTGEAEAGGPWGPPGLAQSVNSKLGRLVFKRLLGRTPLFDL